MDELREMADEMTAVGGIALYIIDWMRDGYPMERIAEELRGISTWCGENAERLREMAGEGC